MKKIITFRRLLDIVFYLTIILIVIMFLGVILAPSLIEIDTKEIQLMGENSTSSLVTILYVFSIAIVFFYSIRALFYLRKVANILSEENCFSNVIIINLKKNRKESFAFRNYKRRSRIYYILI